MRKHYLSAPLPFVGQKRMFAREFINVLKQFPEDTVFVDLFGGSGLLSHIAKCQKPGATVVYNDFDNYRKRLETVPQTNELLADLRKIVSGIPRLKPITGEKRDDVLECIKGYERRYGYVDYITLSPSLLFSMKYKLCIEDMQKETFYNKIRATDYPLCTDYLDGITVVSCDYRELYRQYKDNPNVVFLVDPPYLSTDVGTYNMYWKMSDYLDVLSILAGYRFVYFTSNKSSILELCEWLGRNRTLGNPFEHCKKVEFNTTMNYNSSYTDMMLYTNTEDGIRIAS